MRHVSALPRLEMWWRGTRECLGPQCLRPAASGKGPHGPDTVVRRNGRGPQRVRPSRVWGGHVVATAQKRCTRFQKWAESWLRWNGVPRSVRRTFDRPPHRKGCGHAGGAVTCEGQWQGPEVHGQRESGGSLRDEIFFFVKDPP